MVQVGRRLCFLTEPLLVRVAHQGPGQEHLEGDRPVQAPLAGAEDDAHPAPGDLPEQLVIADIADLGARRDSSPTRCLARSPDLGSETRPAVGSPERRARSSAESVISPLRDRP